MDTFNTNDDQVTWKKQGKKYKSKIGEMIPFLYDTVTNAETGEKVRDIFHFRIRFKSGKKAGPFASIEDAMNYCDNEPDNRIQAMLSNK